MQDHFTCKITWRKGSSFGCIHCEMSINILHFYEFTLRSFNIQVSDYKEYDPPLALKFIIMKTFVKNISLSILLMHLPFE